MKKLLALVLALVMTLSLCTISNAAYADAADVDYDEAVEVMSAIGVFDGMDGKFNPDGILTREQAAKIIAYMLLGKTAADSLSTASAPFTDVAADRWSAGAIAYCASEGILAGVGDGKFDPTGTLTGYAFAKMCLVALGYDADIEGYTGSQWAINVAKRVIAIDLDSDLDVALSNGISRQEAAQMAFNTEKATLVEYTGGTNITVGDTTIKQGATRRNVGDIAEAAGNSYFVGTATPYTQFCEQYAAKLKKTNVGVDDYNIPATEWNYKNEKIGNYTDSSAILATYTTEVGTVTLGDLYKLCPTTDLTLEVYENGTANAANNKTAAKGSTTKAFDTLYQGATIFVVDDDADGKADSLCVKYPYLAKVTKVTEATAKADRYVTLTVYNDASMVASTNVTYETEDFAKDDYVLVYVDGAYATTEAYTHSSGTTLDSQILEVEAAKVVKGTVSTVTGSNGTAVTALTVDGTKYGVADADFATLGLVAGTNKVANSSYSFKTETTLFLANDYVIGVKGASSVGSNIENVVYVTKAAYSKTNEYGESAYMVETVKLDGTVEIVENYGWYDTDLNGGSRVKDGSAYVSATTNASNSIAAGLYVKDYDSATKSYKFTAVGAYDTINNTSVFYGTDTLDGNATMKATTKTVALDNATKAYITADTALIFVDGTGSKLSVTVNNGAMKQTIADDSKVLLSKDSDGNYVAEAIIIGVKKVDVSADTVYVKAGATGVNTNGNEYSMYDIKTGEKTTITSDNANSVNGYVTYSINDKGVYTLTDAGAATEDNGDGWYSISAANKFTKYGASTISVDDTKDIIDLDAADAKIISTVTGYESLTLADLADAATLVGVVLVKDEVVTSIVITTYTES